MELKQRSAEVYIILCLLLIVPYGIETNFGCQAVFRLRPLLIVPYGIETLTGITGLLFGSAFNRTLWN